MGVAPVRPFREAIFNREHADCPLSWIKKLRSWEVSNNGAIASRKPHPQSEEKGGLVNTRTASCSAPTAGRIQSDSFVDVTSFVGSQNIALA